MADLAHLNPWFRNAAHGSRWTPFFARSDGSLPKPLNYWLMKSEPGECSIDDLAAAPGQSLPWTGVRNYQARNFMRDQMRVGDGVLFYHSSCPSPELIGIAGLARVASAAYVDASQFDPNGHYYDAKSKPESPRWLHVDLAFVRKTRLLSRCALKADSKLQSMLVLQPGSRLSITPVTQQEWSRLQEILQAVA